MYYNSFDESNHYNITMILSKMVPSQIEIVHSKTNISLFKVIGKDRNLIKKIYIKNIDKFI